MNAILSSTGAPNCAASQLRGLNLNNGWQVGSCLQRGPESTGGFFSRSYVVTHSDGRRGFLKALDFSEAFGPGVETISVLAQLTASFEHERAILQICATKRLSNVVLAIDHGQVQVPGFGKMDGLVFYLIFDLANGDIRSQVSVIERLSALWSLRALRDVCVGLWQVHQQLIAHQDMKPSNVLVYGESRFHIADFGRSSLQGRPVSHDRFTVAGDRIYSPPELLYGHTHPDFTARRFGCDLYMLGNLASFMFTGGNATASLLTRLNSQFRPTAWKGSYCEVLPYLHDAFGQFLHEIEMNIDPIVRAIVVPLIRQLCNPDLMKRGHPKALGRHDQHSLERYVSSLDLDCKRVAITLRTTEKSV